MAAISSEAASMSKYPPLPIDLGFDLDEVLIDLESCSVLQRKMDESESSLSAMPTVASVTGACPICMEAFRGDNRRASCGHVYHEPCIATWLSLGGSCPLCRCDIISASQP
ncbi:probable E3 ubiquitin-protein ligase RHC1A [Rhodamnia argentea]|uniref:RING-type E3 ubiquitin transferase n=1 Tax=Rhodamnia argentea TaxID=178133 RepID=A0A8B8P5R1_9MYRT|nr:probable E3 ubiquitin-protein ligase RHC1A [Rhodamnia argentea]